MQNWSASGVWQLVLLVTVPNLSKQCFSVLQSDNNSCLSETHRTYPGCQQALFLPHFKRTVSNKFYFLSAFLLDGSETAALVTSSLSCRFNPCTARIRPEDHIFRHISEKYVLKSSFWSSAGFGTLRALGIHFSKRSRLAEPRVNFSVSGAVGFEQNTSLCILQGPSKSLQPEIWEMKNRLIHVEVLWTICKI